MDYLEKSYESGLRAIGPAHYGPGVYARNETQLEELDLKEKSY